jgi:hypothetical protein
MFKPNAEHQRALCLLAQFPDGATAYCLTTLHAVAPPTLAGLELADACTTQVAARSGNGAAMTVTRLRITNAGRRAIAG